MPQMPEWTDADGRRHRFVPTALPSGGDVKFPFYLDTGPLFLVYGGLMDADDELMRSRPALLPRRAQHAHLRSRRRVAPAGLPAARAVELRAVLQLERVPRLAGGRSRAISRRHVQPADGQPVASDLHRLRAPRRHQRHALLACRCRSNWPGCR